MKLKALTICTLIALSACKSDNPQATTGQLSLKITDAPVDSADAVVVEFTGIEIQGQGDRTTIDFATPKTIDLLQLTGSDSTELLPDTTLEAGQYQWIRLKVNAERGVTDSYIDINSGRFSLYVPSGAETGLQLNRPFVVAAGGKTDFTIDFDLRKSVHLPNNGAQDYILRPTLRVVDNLVVGHIKGTVPESLVNATGCTGSSAVYLFSGYDATVDDIDAIDPEPITTSSVELDNTGNYSYEVGFVEAGDYSLAFTCEAENDDPATDDTITFANQMNVTVTANTTATVDF